MKDSWKLNEIYNDFEDKEFLNDMQKLKEKGEEIRIFCLNLSNYKNKTEAVEEYISLNEEFELLCSKLLSYASFRFSYCTKDEDAARELSKVNSIKNSLNESKVRFTSFIDDENIKASIKSGRFMDYTFYLSNLLEKKERSLSPDTESLASSLELTGSLAWQKLQAQTVAKALGNVKKPSDEITDPKERQKAAFLFQKEACQSVEDVCAACLNGIKGEAICMSRKRGFSSPLDQALEGYHFHKDILNNLIESIEEYLPSMREYYKLKAKILGYGEKLPYFERTTPIFNSNISMDFDSAKEMILKAFGSFSEKMYAYGKEFFDSGYIDWEIRGFKESGDSCDGIPVLKQSRIRTHFSNGVSSANTLAHELGHGYHNLNLFTQGILNYGYDLPVAETASKFSEILFKKELAKELGEEGKLFSIDFEVSGYINTLVDILSRFYFEKQIFEEREEGEISAARLNEIMKEAQIKAYGESLDINFAGDFMWVNKPHYYSARRGFYNFPYAFGAVISIKLFEMMKNNPNVFPYRYDLFLASTGKYGVGDLFKLLDMDLFSKDFFVSPLEYISEMVKELSHGIDNKLF